MEPLMVMVVIIEKRVTKNLTTTRTRWQYEVREWTDEWIDLPSLTEFKGNRWNFYYIGSVILESIGLVFDWCRYPSIIIWWYPIRCLLLVHLFPPILKYPFSHFLIIRCCCSRISHQTRKQIPLIPIPLFLLSLTNRLDTHEPLNTQSINRQLPHRFKQTGFHSIHFQRDHRLGEESVKSGIP